MICDVSPVAVLIRPPDSIDSHQIYTTAVYYRVNFRFFTSGQLTYPNVTDSAEIFRFVTSGLLDYAKVMFPPKFLYRCDVSAKVVSSRRSAFSECDILRADLSKCDTLLLCGAEARLDLQHSCVFTTKRTVRTSISIVLYRLSL